MIPLGTSGGGLMKYGPESYSTFSEVLLNNLFFRWPKPLIFMVFGAHGIYIYCLYIYISIYINIYLFMHIYVYIMYIYIFTYISIFTYIYIHHIIFLSRRQGKHTLRGSIPWMAPEVRLFPKTDLLEKLQTDLNLCKNAMYQQKHT